MIGTPMRTRSATPWNVGRPDCVRSWHRRRRTWFVFAPRRKFQDFTRNIFRYRCVFPFASLFGHVNAGAALRPRPDEFTCGPGRLRRRRSLIHSDRIHNMQVLNHADLPALGIRYSRPHLLRLERDGLFPKRLHLSPGRVGWLKSEIEAWIASRAAARDAA